MKINPNIFRGYDLRGLVGTDLNPEIVRQIGKAYGTFLIRRNIKKAVVGRDCRQTGAAYSKALIEGLNWAGVDVFDIGMNLVGTFYWSQYHLESKGGVFVTASHNPAQYNGFKFAIDYSETLVSDGMNELRRMVEEDDLVQGEKIGSCEEIDVRASYLQAISEKMILQKKFKVVLDPSNSTAGAVVPDMLRTLGCEVIEKNCNIDPTFPLGTPDPTEMIVATRLSSEVVAAGADIGFSYDADGDRIGIVDENGGIIWNDVLVALFATDVLRTHAGAKIMYNTLCSKVVEDTIVENGGIPFMWRTGHSFLKKKNQEVGAAFIGELSGHFFFSADFYNHDDGIYSAVRLLSYLSETGQSLSEAVAKLPRYISSPEVKIGCADTEKVALITKLGQVLRKDFPDAEVIDDERAGDGVRLNMPDSMFVVRYSQNGPYLTVKFEAQTAEKYEELRKYLNDELQKYPEVTWGKDNVNGDALEVANESQ